VPTTEASPEPLRHRRRRLVQDEIEGIAIRLFLAHGYDAVSVDDVANAAGMSERTFFRYYSSKDEILRRYQSRLNEALVEAFAAQPAASTALEALRQAYAATSHVLPPDREQVRELGRLLAATPAIHARAVGEMLLDDRLAHEFGRRAGARRTELRPAVVVAAVAAAAHVGWARWVSSDDSRDPAVAVTSAIDALGLPDDSGRRS
jgi:AcrR family transcriptional regulator